MDHTHRAWAIVSAALILAVSAGRPACAQQERGAPTTEPILRINTIAPTTDILSIATDRENRYAVTASNEKIARVWSLADNRLLTVLRVPIDEREMGKLYAVAMTPDGSSVALGGYTGMKGAEKNIYLFDRATGAILRRLSGLPNTINRLVYSPDGRLLAAALGGSRGIRVYDVALGYEPLRSDVDYEGRSNSVDFNGQGQLVTTSDMGLSVSTLPAITTPRSPR
jgi:WD40 repeat protein